MIEKIRKSIWIPKIIIILEFVIYSIIQLLLIEEDGISFFHGLIRVSKGDVVLICILILYTCVCTSLILISKYWEYKRIGKQREKAPYGFFVPDEFLRYRNVGIDNKAISDENVLVFYSNWKKHIIDDFGEYGVDFVRYLNRLHRHDMLYLEAIKTVMIPILVGYVTIYCDGFSGGYSMGVGLACILSIVVICCKEMVQTNDKICLYSDVMEIIEDIINSEMNDNVE